MGELLNQAIAFVVNAHAGQKRKTGVPYVLHPMEAAVIAGSVTADEEVLAAALLHDVIEDAGVKSDEIAARFGRRVADLVLSETEDKRPEQPPESTWEIRKTESLQKLSLAADEGVRIVWLADKLSNIRALYAGVREESDAFFNHFHQKDKARQAWYYRSIARALRSLAHTVAYDEFVYLTEQVFGKADID